MMFHLTCIYRKINFSKIEHSYVIELMELAIYRGSILPIINTKNTYDKKIDEEISSNRHQEGILPTPLRLLRSPLTTDVRTSHPHLGCQV